VAGLGPSFGRGAMTNHWIDLKNTDCAMIIGSNAAENHPISFKWLMKAKEERGAKIISVDPRFTRTSAKADVYAAIRPGTDIAFIGGLINYILQNELYWKDYVVNYTNASAIVSDGYTFEDGLFSGYDPINKKYAVDTWTIKKGPDDKPLKDATLQNPRTVFQLMKKHYSRYGVDTVTGITGVSKDAFLKVAKAFAATGSPDKSGTILYAMGITQHTVGSQNIRALAILQLLLGNIGLPGGGINALRGESNVQGSTDIALLSHLLPGYIGAPTNMPEYASLKAYLEKETPKTGFWSNKPKFMVSLLKAWWGDSATAPSEFAYQYLPKRDAKTDYTHIGVFEAMYDGKINGLFLFGTNPLVGGPNANKESKAMENLDWMVVADLWETESAVFWKRPGAHPNKIKTEVFFLPAASSIEKEGSISNSGRWIQYRWQAVKPVGDSKSDLWMIDQIARRAKELYKDSALPQDEPIKYLTWDFGKGDGPDIDKIALEMGGFETVTGKPMATFADLKEDGSTSCGIWIWGGIMKEGKYLARRRDNKDESGIGSYLNWSYAWPVNRRILYNRCSADIAGRPWSEDKKIIWWDPLAIDPKTGKPGKWVGKDVPDFKLTLAPTDIKGGGTKPFIMQATGLGALFTDKMKEGPFPEHYEPFESPFKNAISSQGLNPAVKVPKTSMNNRGEASKFPCVGTTYRVSEHWQAGAMSRNLPWLAELMPTTFAEISPSLAKARGIKNGDKVKVTSARGEVDAYALVTVRMQPLNVNGKKVEIIGIPWHFGFQGIATGDSANKLTAHIGDANTGIPEYKVFLAETKKVV